MPTSFRIAKVDTTHADVRASILDMHEQCFPGVPLEELHGDWWIAYDRATKAPVGFAGLWPSVRASGAGYLCRAGVLPEGRGKGLQRKLIKVREREAHNKRWVVLYSDCLPGNAHSMNNLYACGFRAFVPPHPWSGEEWNYFRKILVGGVP